MWTNLDKSKYYINFIINEIYITDYISIWYRIFTKHDFINNLKDSNKHLEIEQNEMIEKATDMLTNHIVERQFRILSVDQDKMTVEIGTSYGYPFKMEFTLTKGTSILFFQKVTAPLLRHIDNLQNSQGELCELMVKKDREIEEYKLEGGMLGLKYLKTPGFNIEEHFNKYTVNGIFASPNFNIKDILKNGEQSCAEIQPVQNIKEEVDRNITADENISASSSVPVHPVQNIKEEVENNCASSSTVQNLKKETYISIDTVEQETVKEESLVKYVVPKKKKKLFNL